MRFLYYLFFLTLSFSCRKAPEKNEEKGRENRGIAIVQGGVNIYHAPSLESENAGKYKHRGIVKILDTLSSVKIDSINGYWLKVGLSEEDNYTEEGYPMYVGEFTGYVFSGYVSIDIPKAKSMVFASFFDEFKTKTREKALKLHYLSSGNEHFSSLNRINKKKLNYVDSVLELDNYSSYFYYSWTKLSKNLEGYIIAKEDCEYYECYNLYIWNHRTHTLLNIIPLSYVFGDAGEIESKESWIKDVNGDSIPDIITHYCYTISESTDDFDDSKAILFGETRIIVNETETEIFIIGNDSVIRDTINAIGFNFSLLKPAYCPCDL